MFSVKVFVTKVTENGLPIAFDMSKINVTVTSPVVLLKKLSKEEIQRYTSDTSKPEISKDIEISECTHQIKRSNINSNEARKNEKKKKNEDPLDLVSAKKKHISKKQVMFKFPNREQSCGTATHVNEIDEKSTYSESLMGYSQMTLRQKKQNTETILKKVQSMIECSKDGLSCKKIRKREPINRIAAKISQSNAVSTMIQFKEGEVIWCKLKGFVHWPARIESITKIGGRYSYTVYWFNDYRLSKVFENQLFKFEENFKKFSCNFQNRLGLETASKEALIYIASLNKSFN